MHDRAQFEEGIRNLQINGLKLANDSIKYHDIINSNV